jgi:hypothetical protein
MRPVNFKRVAFWSTLFYVFYTGIFATRREKEITLDVYPRVSISPATVRIRWRIDRHPDNRAWSMSYTSELGVVSSSFKEMHGEEEPEVYTVFRDLRTGYFVFEACVYRPGKKFCDRQEAEVR